MGRFHYPVPKSSEITSEDTYLNRRDFLSLGAGSLATFALGRAGLAWGKTTNGLPAEFTNLPESPYSVDEELTPYKDVTSYNNFYELGSGKKDPKKNAAELKVGDPWTVEVAGECDKSGIYHLEDFIDYHALEDRIYRLRCVEAWSMVIPWVGISMADVLKKFGPSSQARYVAFTSIYDPKNLKAQRRSTLDWPYLEGLRIDEAMNPLSIFSVGIYGKPLLNQNGAPLRIVVPWKYGFKSGKSIVKIEFVRNEPPTAWGRSAPSEYGFYSNVNPEVSHPRWSQKRERRIGDFFKRKTLMFNGYGDQVASLYSGMDLRKNF